MAVGYAKNTGRCMSKVVERERWNKGHCRHSVVTGTVSAATQRCGLKKFDVNI